MTAPDRDPVRELIEQARELRRSEQPPAELFEAALGRLSREELALERSSSSRWWPSHALSGVGRWLLRLHPARLTLVLALAVLVSWGARRHTAIEPHQDEPRVALAPEPAPVHDAARAVEPADHIEQPRTEQPRAGQRLALPAAPAAPPLPPLSEPARRAEGQGGASSSLEPSSGARRLHWGGSAVERDSDPFYTGPPPASILWFDEAGAARVEGSGDQRKFAGSWTVESWILELSPRRPALRQMSDRRQCVDVTRNERLWLGWRPQGGPGRRGFELAQGQRYRLLLSHVSVTGPVQLELIAIVGSSDGSHGRVLATHVMSTPTPSTVGFIFEPRHDDDRAPVSLFVDALGPSGASKLCLGAARLESLPEQAAAGAESASKPAGKANCDPPWYIDDKGIQRSKPECSTNKRADDRARRPDVNCKPPWFIDDKGIKRLKPRCL